MFESILRSIGNSTGSWLYLIAAAFAFAEAAILIGMVLPGETALLVAGVFCNHQYGHLQLGVMIPIAAASAIAGDSVGYEFGRTFGPRLRHSQLGGWVGEPRWTKVDDVIHKYGGKAVFVGRLTAVLRALMPSMAGMSGMRYRTFFVWNAAGGVIWAPGCVLLGYSFASALGTVSSTLTWVPLGILALVVVGFVVLHLRRRKQDRADKAAYQRGLASDPATGNAGPTA